MQIINFNASPDKAVLPVFYRPNNVRPSTASIITHIGSASLVNSNGVCVNTYKSLLNDKKIEVLYNKQTGLSAIIHFLDAQGNVVSKSLPLPLKGMPAEITVQKDVSQIKRFFENTHLIAEKGLEGSYAHVSVHVSGKGGGNGKIPFQPGLALGSVVRGETLIKMEEYAQKMANEETIIEQIKSAEQRIDMLKTKIKARHDVAVQGESGDPLIACWEKQMGAATNFIKTLSAKLNSASGEIPIFENFYQGVESPIDMARSQMEVQPRGFDSLHYNSQYIDMRQELSKIHDRITHSSSASSVSASVGWLMMVGGSASLAGSSATSERLAQIKMEGIAEGVLVINAVATSRHVRCFTDLQYDKRKLQALLNAMNRNNNDELKKYGISKRADGTKEIYLLTEAVLGGSFTALVTFSNESRTDRKEDKFTHEHGISTAVRGGGNFVDWGISIGNSNAIQYGIQTESDILRSIVGTKVSIEIISQGAMPIFAREVVEREIMKHVDLNPSKFELSKKDEEDAEIMATGKEKEKALAVLQRRMKMENAQVAVMNTYRGLTSSKEKQNVHSTQSVMEAYENFVTQMTTDRDCGIPIGFNYQILTQKEIEEMLEELSPSFKEAEQGKPSVSQATQKPEKDTKGKQYEGQAPQNPPQTQ
ncbi:hypothetical protein DB42_CO00210 [Neochlamydia sp. EPS4]|uniref:hypothetical protein n=1 Tax=Neochlamydia sp. EPS4 TaxID=1478175 RepID=UPI000582B0FC|nr:hypothetical protein [Neochlamydia sp. EPS4]KIC72986.1 hypothetical protein DB42_CO00210 [Neochlamydia sp. EPS4]